MCLMYNQNQGGEVLACLMYNQNHGGGGLGLMYIGVHVVTRGGVTVDKCKCAAVQKVCDWRREMKHLFLWSGPTKFPKLKKF